MRPRDWLAVVAGVAALCVSVLVIGSAWRWTQALVGLLVAIALASQLTSRRAFSRISPLVVLPAIAAGLTALQLLPMGGLLEHLAPTGSALRDDGAALLDIEPWAGATLDAPGSLRGLAFFVILLGIAVVALRLAVSERGRYRLLAATAALCGVTAVVVWIHEIVDAQSVYGIYTPHAGPHLLGPLLNLNHLGCLMAVGTVLSTGLVMYRRQPVWLRVAWIAVITACGSLTVATVSRGATLALGVGALVTLMMLVGQRLSSSEGRQKDLLTKSLPIAIVAICTVVIVIYSNATNVQNALGDTSMSELTRSRTKFAAWKSAFDLVEESPWIGVGRGAFEPAFTRVYPDAGFSTFSHAENAYIQAVVDWGIPGALALAVVFAWFWLVALRRWRDGPLAAGALGALVVVAIQSNVDFGVELLAIAAPITVIAATVAYVPLREVTDRALATARLVRVVHVAGLAGAAALLITSLTTTIVEDHRALDGKPTRAQILEAVERHPLDYYGYAIAAQERARANDPAAIRLLNHALRLHPTHPGLHRIAARLLLQDGYVAQAAYEYAEAIRGARTPDVFIAEVVKQFPVAHAPTALPEDYPYPAELVRQVVDLGRTDVAIGWLLRVRKHRPNDARICEQLYTLALVQKNLDAANAANQHCGDLPPDPATRLALAQLLLEQKAYGQVLQLVGDVERWTGHVDTRSAAWLLQCDAHIGLGALDEAKRCVRRLDAAGILDASKAAELAARLAKIDDLRRAQPVPTPN